MVTRHLDTIGIVDLTAEGIFTGIKSTLERYNLPFGNLLSLTSDTCNTMKGARGGVITKMQPKIIDVYCICHLVSLCVKAATKTVVSIQWTGLLDWTTGMTFDLTFDQVPGSNQPKKNIFFFNPMQKMSFD